METVTSVTNSQLTKLTHKDKKFFLDEKEIDKIRTVGQVIKKDAKNNIISLKIDDGTATIQVIVIKKYGEEVAD